MTLLTRIMFGTGGQRAFFSPCTSHLSGESLTGKVTAALINFFKNQSSAKIVSSPGWYEGQARVHLEGAKLYRKAHEAAIQKKMARLIEEPK